MPDNITSMPTPKAADPKVKPPATVTEADLLKPMDTKSLRTRIYDHAFEAVKNLEPVQNSRYKLHTENHRWIDPETWTPAQQKKVFYQGGTLARRIAGDWVMTDLKTGQEVSRKNATIAAIPHLNDRGLFLLNGTHWHLGSQTRLDPGVYPRRQENGDIEAYVNPKGGRPHRIALEPSSGVFHIEMGTSKIPLLPILQSLGADNKKLHEAWGHDLLVKNAEKTDGTAVSKMVKKLYDKGAPEGMNDHQALAAKLAGWQLDPYVTQRTIGVPHSQHGVDSLLETSKRLLAISRGEAPSVERDHQAFQHVLGQEHLFAERIKQSKQLLNQLLWKSTFKGNLDHLPSGALNHHVAETITGTGLGVTAQMTNPAEMLDSAYRVSKMGSGGIRSLDAVPDSARETHPSQFGYIDPIVTPESGKVGVDLRFSSGSARDRQGKIYSQYRDQSGRPAWLTARDLQDKTIAPPEEMNKPGNMVGAIRNGEFMRVPKNQVDLWSSPTESGFSPVANLVPFKSASPAHRTAMGTRMYTQALPLVGGESPLVQSGHPEGSSYEERYGQHFGAVKADRPGRVVSVSPDAIKVRYHDGETGEIPLHKHDLYDHAPGRKTHFTQTPTLKPGDSFQPGQLLARSNYTDKDGKVALGMNARVAWIPGRRGSTFEDSFGISQSYANRMRSDHMSLHSVEEPGARFGKKDFRSLFPTKYTPDMLKNLNDEGVIQPGAVVQPGQPLVLASKKIDSPRTTLVRSPKPIHQDASEIWDHDYPGKVVDVVKTRTGYRVSVQSSVPMQDLDKLAGRHGNKGIVTIIPDHEMPIGEDGKPFEVLASPYTLPSRKNDSQIAEVGLGKIAAKTGKPYAIPDFRLPDLMQFTQDELQKHGLKDTESVLDPVTGQKIHGVLTGNQFFMKLHHLVESKLKQRDTGGYDSYGSPARGGAEGAKRMALADTFALLSHGANSFLNGSKLVRGQRNEGWWEATMSGYTPPTPGVPMQYQRFLEGFKAAGIHPVNENGKLRLKAITDKDVERLSGGRELKNAKGVNWNKGGEPIEGGLFDRGLHGEAGDRWSSIRLHAPMPNPAFEDPVLRTLGLTEKQMRNVLASKGGFHNGKYVEPAVGENMPRGYQTGPQGLKSALQNIDLDHEIKKAHEEIAGTKKTKKDLAIRRLKFLQGAKDQGRHPSDWMMQQVPVLPPKFRPVSRLEGSNTEISADSNALYQDLFNANQNLKELSGKVKDTSDEHLALYDAFKAVSGLGDPINPKNVQKGVKGILKLLLAESPKWSIPQNKLLSTPVDLVGRSTIGPDSNLDMDEIGIPEGMAFKVYSRFLAKRLVQGGMAPGEAVKHIQEQSPIARRALLKEMDERPVSYHRAPVLHKYGHIGGWARLVKGDGLKLSPFVYKGLGGDNDGNCCVYYCKITLVICWGEVYNSLVGQTGLAAWEGFKMKLVASGQVVVEQDNSVVVVEIGSFPRTGEPVKDKNGADVYSVPAGVKVFSYDHKTGKAGFEPVTRFTVDKNHPCHMVKTARGKKVEVSSNESLVAFNADTGELDKIKPENCVGRMVPVIRKMNTFGDFGTRELGWWYGSLVADGWVSARTIGYSKNDPAKREEFLRLAKELFGSFISYEYIEPKNEDKFSDSAKIHINNRETVSRVLNIYDDRAHPDLRGALRKKLPDVLLARGSRECLLGLLAGLLDGDAFVGWANSKDKPQFVANLYTSSPYLRDDISHLCCRLGIRYSITTTPAAGVRHEAYIICLSSIDLKPLCKELVLTGTEAHKVIEDFAAGSSGKRECRDSIPITKAQAKILADVCRKDHNTLYTCCRSSLKSGRIGRESAERALAIAGDKEGLGQLKAIVANEDVVWDIYDQIEETEKQDVFDLEVLTTKVFAIHNGLVIYDTANIHVPVYPEEIQDIKDKMMPSRNLLSVKDFLPHYKPEREFHVGLYQATEPQDKGPHQRTRVFEDAAALRRAFQNGEITVHDKVTVMKH